MRDRERERDGERERERERERELLPIFDGASLPAVSRQALRFSFMRLPSSAF